MNDWEELKKALAGKSVPDAEKVLGEIGSLSEYSIEIRPVIPFFKNVPRDLNRINLEIENEAIILIAFIALLIVKYLNQMG